MDIRTPTGRIEHTSAGSQQPLRGRGHSTAHYEPRLQETSDKQRLQCLLEV